jgi:glyoxylase-like metal-dependent hydrolase (beta-lactamase superfamily II)
MLVYDEIVKGIFLVKSDAKFPRTCQGILINDVNDSGNVLIDCNFTRRDYKQLLKRLDDRVDAYIATHSHIDHVSYLHEFEKLKPEVPKYCPIPEDKNLLDLNQFIDSVGANEFGVGEFMKEMMYGVAGFKEIKSIKPSDPKKNFEFGGILLKTLFLPSHSPGHVGFIIENMMTNQRKILFASDIGVDDHYPWYGFKYNELKTIRRELAELKELYMSEDFILVSGHGKIHLEKQPEVFDQVVNIINAQQKKVLNLFDVNNPRKLRDLVLQGVIYNQRTLEKYAQTFKYYEQLSFFWEGYFILNQIEELVEKGTLVQVKDGNKITDATWNLRA